MTPEEQKQAEAASWKRWQAEWGNTESGAHAFGWESGYHAAHDEIERRQGAVSELLAAIEDYDNGRNDRGEAGRIGRLLQLRRETDITPNEHWMPDAVRVWKALTALTDTERPGEHQQ